MKFGVDDFYPLPNQNDNYKQFVSSSITGDQSASILGVYINSMKEAKLDCLIVTENGIHILDSRGERVLAFEEMAEAVEPAQGDEDLDIVLKSGDCVALSVRGSTDGEPDIDVMHEFLTCVLEMRSADDKDILDIESDEDLIQWLGPWKEEEGSHEWLRRDALLEEFELLDIDPEILDQRGIWRLLALVLMVTPYND